jgi:polysaccharide export outer membrane protein
MKRYSTFAVLMLVLTPVIPALAQKRSEQPAANSQAISNTQAKPQAVSNDTYIIGAGDELSISVWKEPDLTRVIPVRPDGKISMPLLNDVQAAGQTPMQLSATITDKLSKFMKDPQVTVVVTTINSQRIYILGSVGRAGAYAMLPNMTVLQAISSAGGLSQYAKEKNIYILRTENGHQTRFPFNYQQVIRGQKVEQNILLQPGDTIVVP